MEWLAQYAEFGLVNERKLALVFVREVGAIDNATYRQLDSSITHARARLEIHKLCDLGFIEKKGQGRSTYYIRTSKVVSLGERLRPQDERLLPQHGTLGQKIHPHFAGNPKICVFSNVSAIKICVFSNVSAIKICVFSNISAKKICVFSKIFVFLHRQKA